MVLWKENRILTTCWTYFRDDLMRVDFKTPSFTWIIIPSVHQLPPGVKTLRNDEHLDSTGRYGHKLRIIISVQWVSRGRDSLETATPRAKWNPSSRYSCGSTQSQKKPLLLLGNCFPLFIHPEAGTTWPLHYIEGVGICLVIYRHKTATVSCFFQFPPGGANVMYGHLIKLLPLRSDLLCEMLLFPIYIFVFNPWPWRWRWLKQCLPASSLPTYLSTWVDRNKLPTTLYFSSLLQQP